MASIIYCTKDEGEGLEYVLSRTPKNHEVIVVDNSTDNTSDVAKKYGVKLIEEGADGRGKGYAMKTGVEHATQEDIVFLDADGTDNPGFIDALLKKLDYGVMVVGIKDFIDVPNPFFRFFHLNPNALFPLFNIIGIECNDPITGYRAFKKKDFLAMNLKSNDFMIETEMNIRCLEKGMRIEFVIIEGGKRLGESKFLQSSETWFRILGAVVDAKSRGILGGICPGCGKNTLVFYQNSEPRCLLCG